MLFPNLNKQDLKDLKPQTAKPTNSRKNYE